MNKKSQTIQTYNIHAKEFASKFNSLGGYTDLKEVFNFLNKQDPNVLEIGCGNGRDAKEILKYTKNYLGIDASARFIEIAKQNVPKARFLVQDIENFNFPSNLDVVFAFASLIHVDKNSLEKIFKHIYNSLNVGGIFRLSLKRSNHYKEQAKHDEYGLRFYYLYSERDIKKLANNFDICEISSYTLGDSQWLKVVLQK